MNRNGSSVIQLVITAALKKEIPKDWFTSRNVPVHTLAALKSGALSQVDRTHSGILVLITGSGLKASEEAACWIGDNLSPLFVLNIGTCGIANKRHPQGKWFSPQNAANENGDSIELDTRLPIPYPEITHANSLLSVKTAAYENTPSSWGKHDIIDMECFSQARAFSETDISFHCLKFGTDYFDSNTISDFNKNLTLFQEEIKKVFSFLEFSSGPLKVTAVVPVYNREQTIQRAIDSILDQSLLPEEIIVVDDCSTDRTPDILKRYGRKITVIQLSENYGPSKARNEGNTHVRTEWIAFMDSDDCWEKDKLKKQAHYLSKYPFYRIIQSDEKWIRNGKRVNPCNHHRKPLGWIWEPSLERCLLSPSGVLIQKSLFDKHGGFDEALPVCEDYDLWLKISRHHLVGLEPDLSVIKYGGHSGQLSRAYPAMDRYRVQSLAALLTKEEYPHYREKIIPVLLKKLKILITGYEKRGKEREAAECRKILRSIMQ
jgi:glycosyltransferase involved in cell wall biosynthesis